MGETDYNNHMGDVNWLKQMCAALETFKSLAEFQINRLEDMGGGDLHLTDGEREMIQNQSQQVYRTPYDKMLGVPPMSADEIIQSIEADREVQQQTAKVVAGDVLSEVLDSLDKSILARDAWQKNGLSNYFDEMTRRALLHASNQLNDSLGVLEAQRLIITQYMARQKVHSQEIVSALENAIMATA